MQKPLLSTDVFPNEKPHYYVLDGLRGVAAMAVVWFHIFEAFASSHLDQIINHGYLAVDFFFILSGFVIAYAYDDRWKTMSGFEFIKRRLIRLHPMVVIGALIGGAIFYTQGCEFWDVSLITFSSLIFATFLNVFLFPASTSMEIRGVGEMYPLNGPSWSLFFEYIGNILYALVLRLLPTAALIAVIVLAGCGLGYYAMFGPDGDICAGFSMTQPGFLAGFLRMLFSFSAGLLLFRIFKPIKIKGSFWICSAVILTLMAIPRIGGAEYLWVNGLYDTICFAVIFPLVVYIGACGKAESPMMKKMCNFLGNISYPLYMVHYPFIYLYFAWVKNENLTIVESLPGAVAVFIGSIILAYICLRCYDIPVRKFLAKKFLRKQS